MKTVDILIKNANEVLTLRGPRRARSGKEMRELGIIKDGYVAIDEGKIVGVGRGKGDFNADEVIDAKGKIVMPGFVDPHTHLVFSGWRDFELKLKLKGLSYEEISREGGGINYTVQLTRKASKEKLVEEAMERLDMMLLHGTTTCEAKSGYGLDVENEIKILEVYKELNSKHQIDIVPTFLGAHAVPPEYKDSDDYVKLIVEEMIPKVVEKNLANFCDVFCERGYFNLDQSRRILLRGKEYGLKPKLHADEFCSLGCSKLACEVKAISADHLLKVPDDVIPELARAGTIAILLPATVFSMMNKEFAPARKLIDSGVAVALGTDLNPNCYTENMQFVIQLACFYMGMQPEEAIVASTINAAYSIEKGNQLGSIEEGKLADVLILNAPSYTFLSYHFGVNLVNTVIKRGKIVYQQDF